VSLLTSGKIKNLKELPTYRPSGLRKVNARTLQGIYRRLLVRGAVSPTFVFSLGHAQALALISAASEFRVPRCGSHTRLTIVEIPANLLKNVEWADPRPSCG